MSSYPGDYDNLSPGSPNPTSPRTSPSLAGEVTDTNSAIDAIQETLGLSPHGIHPNVAARLQALEQTILQGVPIGLISAFGGTTAPDGWLLCQGQAVSRTTYSALFSVIGTGYGPGDGSTTFNLPNFSDRRVPVGPVSGTSGRGSTDKTTASQSTSTSGTSSKVQADPAGQHSHGMSHTHTISHTHTVSVNSHTHTHQHITTAGSGTPAKDTGPASNTHTHSLGAPSPVSSGASTLANTNQSGSHTHDIEHTHNIAHTHTLTAVGVTFIIRTGV